MSELVIWDLASGQRRGIKPATLVRMTSSAGQTVSPGSEIRLYARTASGRSMFDALVESWNSLGPHERTAKRAECGRDGHQWCNVVDKDGKTVYVVCRHCCEYK